MLDAPSGDTRRLDFDTYVPLAYALVYMALSLSVHLVFFPIGDIGVESDFYGELVVAAQKLWRGSFAVANYPYKGPVYSFALVLVRALVRDWYLSGVVLNAFCAGCALVVLYRLLCGLFDRRLAAVAVVAVSLVSEFFILSHKACSDMLFFLLCFLTISLLLSERWSWWRIAAGGILGALAFLTRYIGIFLPVGAVITFLFVHPWRLPLRKRFASAGLYVGVFFLVCLPWFVMSYRGTGNIVATGNLENIVEEFYGAASSREVPEDGFDSVRAVIVHDPGYFVGRFLLNIPRHLWLDMRETLGIAFGILLLIGLVRLLFVHPTRRQGALYLFSLCYFLPMCLIFHLRRFSLPLLPAYAAIGVLVFIGGRGRGVPPRTLFAAFTGRLRSSRGVLVIMIVVLFMYEIARIVKYERYYYQAHPLFVKEAASFLETRAAQRKKAISPTVMARKPHIAYYAGMRYQQYPKFVYGNHEFLAFAIGHEVDLVVFSLIEQKHYAESDFLMSLDDTPGVAKIYETPEIIIYELSRWLNLGTAAGKRALADYQSRLSDAEAGGDIDAILGGLYNLAGLYAVNGEWNEQAAHLQQALDVTGTMADRTAAARHEGSIRLNLAQAYLLGGRHDRSIELLEENIVYFSRCGDAEKLGGSHLLLAQNYRELGKNGKAVRSLRTAHHIFTTLGNEGRVADIERVMRELEGN